jgi:hypothetical protein
VATIGGHNGTLSAWSTLLINPVGGNVGIGTSSPSEALDVGGKVKTAALQITGGAAAGYILQSDASGNATWVANPGLAETDPKVGANTTNFLSKWNGTQLVASTVREDAGNVAIGMATPPNAKLQVNGNVILGSTGTRFGSIVSIDINIPQLDPLGGAGAGVKTIPWPVDMDISPNASIIVTPKSQLANGMTIGYAWRSAVREISVYYINHFNNTPVTQAEHTLRITVINFEQ